MRLKAVIRVFVAVIVVALVAGYGFLYFQDHSRLKGLIEQAVQDASGRQLVIRGDLSLALSLKPTLEVKDVTLANTRWGSEPQMVTVGLLRVRLKLLSLLAGEVRFKDIELADTRVLLEKDADGQANWFFSPDNAARADVAIRNFGIKRLQIEQLNITLRSDETGLADEHYTVDSLKLKTTSDKRSLEVELEGYSNQQHLSLTGTTGLLRDLFSGSHFPLSLSGEVAKARVLINGSIANALTLTGIELGLQGSGSDLAAVGTLFRARLPATRHFNIQAQLVGDYNSLSARQLKGWFDLTGMKLEIGGRVDGLSVSNELQLDVKGSGDDLARLGQAVGRTLPSSGPFSFSGKINGTASQPVLRNARGTVGRQDHKLKLSGTVNNLIKLEGIDLRADGSGSDLAQLGPVIGFSLPETGEFSVGGRLTGNATTLALSELQGSVSHDSVKLNLTGKIEDLQQLQGVDLGFDGGGKDFSELGVLFDARLPALGSFSFSGKLGGSRKRLGIKNFAAKLDNSDFNGWSEIEFGKKPKITVKLESGLIDFTRIMDQFKGEVGEETVQADDAGRTLFSKQPLPFGVLDAVAADISLRARNIKARDAALEFGQLVLHLDDGKLSLDTLEAVYKTSRLSANLGARAGPPAHVSTRFLVQGFELGEFLKETDISDEVEARADIAVDLRSLGSSSHDLASNLDGVFAMVIGTGKMPRVLDILAEDLSRRVMSVWRHYGEAGNLNCGAVDFGIQQGIATSNTFLLDTQVGYLKGEGTINLGTEQIDFLLTPKPRDPSLFSLATRLRVSGSVLDPTVRPDTKSLAVKGAKALSALVVGPAGLLAPFVSLGAPDQHPCDMQALLKKLHEIYQ